MSAKIVKKAGGASLCLGPFSLLRSRLVHLQERIRQISSVERAVPRGLSSSVSPPLQGPASNGTNPTSVPLRTGVSAKRAFIRRQIKAGGKLSMEDKSLPVYTIVSICTAEAYDMEKLGSFLQSTFPKTSSLQEDVLHVKMQIIDSTRPVDTSQCTDAFFFGDGCFVLWGSPAEVSAMLLKFRESLRPFEIGSLERGETETLFYQSITSDRFYAGMNGEMIVLEEPEVEMGQEGVRAKLAFSNGLVDSVKLAVLENELHAHIERVKLIPLTLASGGKLPVGRAEVLRLTGELLKFRAELNLHSELIDTPEMYWSEPQLEELYRRVSRVLDIRQRAHVLNKKLDYANELAAVLRSHLSERHGLKLEWGIIVLIAVEVAFETLHSFVQIVK